MTIQLSQAVRHAGSVLAAGSTQTLEASLEADLVNRKIATYLSDPAAVLNDVPVTSRTNPVTGVISFSAPDGSTAMKIGGTAQSHVTVTAPADTAENVLFQATLKGGVLGPNDTVRVSYLGACTNSANSKTIRAYFGGSNIAMQALTTAAAFKMQTQFSNRNSQSAQIMAGTSSGLSVGPNGTSSVAPAVLAIDTSQDQVLSITGQKTSGGEMLTIESVIVEIVRAGQ